MRAKASPQVSMSSGLQAVWRTLLHMHSHTRRWRRACASALAGALLLTSSALAEPEVTPWSLEGCDGVIALIPLPADVLQAHLPAGFSPSIPASVRATLPPDPRLEAALGIEAFTCDSGVLGDAASPVAYGSTWALVEPPSELADPTAALSFLKFESLVDDDSQRERLRERGMAARDGSVHLDLFMGTPAGTALDVRLSMDGGAEVSRLTGVAALQQDFSGTFIEYSPLAEGYGEWRTSYATSAAHGGGGIVHVPQGSVAARILGETRVQAYVIAVQGLAFTGGTLTLPEDPERAADAG